MTSPEDAQFESMMAQSGIVLDPNEFLERDIEGRRYELDGVAGRSFENEVMGIVHAVSKEMTALGIPPESDEFAKETVTKMGQYVQENSLLLREKEIVVSGLGLVLLQDGSGDFDSILLEPEETIFAPAWYLSYGKYAFMPVESLKRAIYGEKVNLQEISHRLGPVVVQKGAGIFSQFSDSVDIGDEQLVISPIAQMGLRIYQAKPIREG